MAFDEEKYGIDDRDNISLYFADAIKEPLLTREEEIDITRRVKSGDTNARNKLIKSNLRFVITVAKQYQNKGISLDDLIMEGNLGLITAVDRFEPDRGYHFISYAVYWIKQAIFKAINEKSRLIRLPLNKAMDLVDVERAVHQLYYKSGKMPGIGELSDYLNRDEDEVSNILSLNVDHLSIETHTVGSMSFNFNEMLEDKTMRSVDYELLNKELSEELEKSMNDLDEFEKSIIKARYGIGEDRKRLRELGSKYKISKERVRQMEKKALRKMYLSRHLSLKDFIVR